MTAAPAPQPPVTPARPGRAPSSTSCTRHTFTAWRVLGRRHVRYCLDCPAAQERNVRPLPARTHPGRAGTASAR